MYDEYKKADTRMVVKSGAPIPPEAGGGWTKVRTKPTIDAKAAADIATKGYCARRIDITFSEN